MDNKMNEEFCISESDNESLFSDDDLFHDDNKLYNDDGDESSDEDNKSDKSDESEEDYENDSLPDDDEIDHTIYSFKLSLLNHTPLIKFIRNQGDQYDISGVLKEKTLRLSSVSGNKNKLLTIEICNPLMIHIDPNADIENNPIQFGMTFPDEFIPGNNELIINRGHSYTILYAEDNEYNKIDHKFQSTTASGYIRYLDWDGMGVEMYSEKRLIDINQLIHLSYAAVTLCDQVDDMSICIDVYPSTEMLLFHVMHKSTLITSSHIGKYCNGRIKTSSENLIQLRLPFSDIYEIITDPTLLLKNTSVVMHIMEKMPLVIKHKFNNSNLSIAIIQES